MAGRAAEHSRRGIDDLVAMFVPVIHAVGTNNDLRIGFELAIRRERHPKLVHRDVLGGKLIAQRKFGVAHDVILLAMTRHGNVGPG